MKISTGVSTVNPFPCQVALLECLHLWRKGPTDADGLAPHDVSAEIGFCRAVPTVVLTAGQKRVTVFLGTRVPLWLVSLNDARLSDDEATADESTKKVNRSRMTSTSCSDIFHVSAWLATLWACRWTHVCLTKVRHSFSTF